MLLKKYCCFCQIIDDVVGEVLWHYFRRRVISHGDVAFLFAEFHLQVICLQAFGGRVFGSQGWDLCSQLLFQIGRVYYWIYYCSKYLLLLLLFK